MDLIKYRSNLKSWCCILAGITMYALALDLFLVGNGIAAGGLSGFAIVLNSFIPLNIALIVFVINIPILFAAMLINGWRYTISAVVGSALYSFMIQLFSGLPTITTDPLVAAVFGGAAYGAGMALLVIGNGSTGGTDLVIRLLVKKISGISLGKMALLVDGIIIVFAIIAFQDIEVGLYAIITIGICSYVADRIVLGFDRGCLCMVVTSQDPQALSATLMTKLKRGVTKVPGLGMYTAVERSILFIAVRPQETPKVKKILSIEDPNAFVMVLPANEVLGGSFRNLYLNGNG